MIIIIRTDIFVEIRLNINVKEMAYSGNGIDGKFIWMGEEGHHKAVEMCLSKAELDTLERTYNLSELEVAQEVKENGI